MTTPYFRHVVKVDDTDIAGMVLAGATITHGAVGGSRISEPSSCYVQLISYDAAGELVSTYPEFTFGEGIPSGFVDQYADRYEGGESRLNLGAAVEVGTTTPTGFVDTYVDTYDGGFESTRFVGHITSIDVTPSLVVITAVDSLEQLARIMVNPSGWPAETDTARVQRIATAAGIPITVEGAATHTVAAVDATAGSVPAWSLLTAVAEQAGAVLYNKRENAVYYRTIHATGAQRVAAAPGATLLDGLKLNQELGNLANEVTVTYGDPAVSLTVTDTDSIGKYGRRARAVSLDVTSEADARAAANRMLAELKAPSWRMEAATVNLRLAETATAGYPSNVADLLDLELEDELEVGQLLPAWPVDLYAARIAGYVEQLDPYDWQISYTLDPNRSTA